MEDKPMKWILIIGGIIVLAIFGWIMEMVENQSKPKKPTSSTYILVTERKVRPKPPQKKSQSTADDVGASCFWIIVVVVVILYFLAK